MMLCLVTDRRRLGLAVGAQASDWHDVLRTQVAAAAEAGVALIQVREPDLEAGALSDLVRSLVSVTIHTAARVVVNDRVDVALAAGASGVHLKERSFAPADVRRVVPAGFLIGCSVHTTAGALARNAADFLIAGTVLPTVSKASVEKLGEDGLRNIVEVAAERPVLAIGGLDVSSMPLVVASGAAGMAAIGAFIPTGGQDVSEFVQKRVHELRFALESRSAGT